MREQVLAEGPTNTLTKSLQRIVFQNLQQLPVYRHWAFMYTASHIITLLRCCAVNQFL